jgi:chorismate mutase
VVGEEEAAADQFALWLLSEDRAGPGLAVAHYVFVLLSLNEEWTDERVIDPHGLDLRRAQRIACWLASIDELRAATMLTMAERRHCSMAVAQARESWSRLLAPYRLRRRSGSKPYFITDAARGISDSAVTARARRRTR